MRFVIGLILCLSVPSWAQPTDVNVPAPNKRHVVFKQDFEDDTLGPYLESQWRDDWNSPPWANHSIGYGDIIQIDNQKALKVPIKKDSFLFDGSGVQWWTSFDKAYTDLWLTYRLYFSPNFDIENLHGKLPGLAGGTGHNSGGDLPDGKTGWSARYMFHQTGFIFYLYHPDNYKNGFYKDAKPIPGKRYYGEGVEFDQGKSYGHSKWITITQRIVMNTPGQHNGWVQGYINGKPAAKRDHLRFRDIPSLAIDKLFFAVFLGGSGDHPKTDGYILFDDFEVFVTDKGEG